MSDAVATFLVALFLIAVIVVPLGLMALLGALAIWKAFKDRCTCKRCGGAFYPMRSKSPRDMCPACLAAKRGAARRGGCVRLLLAWAAVTGLLGWYLSRLGVPGGAAYLIAGAAFIGAEVIVSKGWRLFWLALARQALRIFERIDFAAARKAAGRPGRVLARAGLSVWTDAPAEFDGEIEAVVAATVGAFSERTGLDNVGVNGLRALFFGTEAAFASYTAGTHPGLGRASGYYSEWPRGRAVVCWEMACRLPGRPRTALSHELAHHLLRMKLGVRPSPWLDEGVAGLVASMQEGHLAAPGAGHRWMLASRARGELLSGGDLVSTGRHALTARLGRWHRLEDWTFVRSFYVQSAMLVAFLRGRDARSFARLLLLECRPRRNRNRFRECFGVSPDEAMELAVGTLVSRSPPPHEAPRGPLRERIDRELVAPIVDLDATDDERRLAIRCMGAAGYPWRAGALAEALEHEDDSVKAEAQKALEDIAGELRGGDPAAWREWLDSLPEGVVAPSRAPG